MRIVVSLTETDLQEIVVDHLAKKVGESFDPKNVTIEVKSAQNWKAEWERAHFRATYAADIR